MGGGVTNLRRRGVRREPVCVVALRRGGQALSTPTTSEEAGGDAALVLLELVRRALQQDLATGAASFGTEIVDPFLFLVRSCPCELSNA